MGIGEGVFTFAAFNQLRKLGAGFTEAQDQLYGAEIDCSAYNPALIINSATTHQPIPEKARPGLQNSLESTSKRAWIPSYSWIPGRAFAGMTKWPKR